MVSGKCSEEEDCHVTHVSLVSLTVIGGIERVGGAVNHLLGGLRVHLLVEHLQHKQETLILHTYLLTCRRQWRPTYLDHDASVVFPASTCPAGHLDVLAGGDPPEVLQHNTSDGAQPVGRIRYMQSIEMEREGERTLPSNLRAWVNTTVLAGMLMPMEKVSVANRHLIRPSWNRISITSFSMGSCEYKRGMHEAGQRAL